MKLISLNIEWNKHLDRILPFIRSERPAVLCLQEVDFSTLSLFEAEGYASTFLPYTRDRFAESSGEFGIALLTNTSSVAVTHTEMYYYEHEHGPLLRYDKNNPEGTIKRGVIACTLTYNGESYLILTTHFPDAPNGSIPTNAQKEALAKLIAYTNTLPPHIICGDFNLPRNENPLYEELRVLYTNAVPDEYASSLDQTYHRLKDKADARILFTHYMVDHLLLQKPYTAENVRLHFGVSDHGAIVATIKKQ